MLPNATFTYKTQNLLCHVQKPTEVSQKHDFTKNTYHFGSIVTQLGEQEK